MNSVKVLVSKETKRKYWQMYYLDPITGKQKKRSTKETTKTKAIRAAAKWETHLNNGEYQEVSKLKWHEFVDKYELEVMPTLGNGTSGIRRAVFNHLTEYCNPQYLQRVATTRMMSQFQAWLRSKKLSENSIRCYLGHLRSIFSWANKQGFIKSKVEFQIPKPAGGSLMKGRALTDGEFQLLLDSVHHVRKSDSANWKFFLRGLWLSGLRLHEALELSWDDHHPFRIHLDLLNPHFAIEDKQKNRKRQLVPMAPEFWELISTVPTSKRKGYVLPLPPQTGGEGQISLKRVGRYISEIGKVSGIVTNHSKHRTASAHDLRRSFGVRWSKRVPEDHLKLLMRHENIETTRQFYAELDVDHVSTQIWNFANSTKKMALR